MPWKNSVEMWDLIGALIVSIVSGVISITRRIVNGYPASILWVTSEFMTAIFFGYLMYDAYPYLHADMPKWFTMPIAVAFSAHVGGRLFQEFENEFIRRYVKTFDRRKN